MALPVEPLSFPACREWSRSQGLRPIGSAGSYDGFLLVEQALPWPRDVGDGGPLSALAGLCGRANFRLQAVVPDGKASEGYRRMICYRRGEPGWAAPLVRSEALVREEELAPAAAALMAGPGTGRPPAPPALRDPGTRTGDAVDVLVCTHGSRDACCGSRGTALFLGLSQGPGPLGGAARVWRTSHTGGHRFAPTVVMLPEATMWAFADEELLGALVGRAPWHPALWERYRGCALIGGPAEQALEGAVAAVVGRALLEDRRRAEVLAPAARGGRGEPGPGPRGDGPAPLRPEGPSGGAGEASGGAGEASALRLLTASSGTWQGVVRAGRRVAQPDCRTDPALARKFSTEWVVEDLTRVAPA